MKKCSKCQLNKELEFFSKNRAKSDGLANYCKECFSKMEREKYRDNIDFYRKKHRLHNRERRKKIRKFLDEIKNAPCADCGR